MISQEKARECIDCFISTDRLRRKFIERKVRSMGIHHSQHLLLMYLSKHDKFANQKDIAKKFDISPAAVAMSIKKLEHSGYISRCSSESDNRFNEVRITEKGLDIIEQSSEVFKYLDEKTFKNFTEEEINQLIFLLNKMKKSLKEEECI